MFVLFCFVFFPSKKAPKKKNERQRWIWRYLFFFFFDVTKIPVLEICNLIFLILVFLLKKTIASLSISFLFIICAIFWSEFRNQFLLWGTKVWPIHFIVLKTRFSLSLNLYILFWSRCFARWLIIIKLYLMIMPSCFFVLFFFCGVECLSSLFTLCFFFFLNIGTTFLFWTGNHGDETYFLKTLSFPNNNNKQLYITINIYCTAGHYFVSSSINWHVCVVYLWVPSPTKNGNISGLGHITVRTSTAL